MHLPYYKAKEQWKQFQVPCSRLHIGALYRYHSYSYIYMTLQDWQKISLLKNRPLHIDQGHHAQTVLSVFKRLVNVLVNVLSAMKMVR